MSERCPKYRSQRRTTAPPRWARVVRVAPSYTSIKAIGDDVLAAGAQLRP